MGKKQHVLLGSLALFTFSGATKICGTRIGSEPIEQTIAVGQIRQAPTCDERQFARELIAPYNYCEATFRMNTEEELTGKSDDEDMALTEEINALRQAGLDAIQIGPDSLIIFSPDGDDDDLTADELENIKAAAERGTTKLELLPDDENTVNISLNETSEMSTEKFAF